AISASHTGDDPFLVQRRNGPRKVFSASSPASRTAANNKSRSASGLPAGNGETLHADGRRIGAVAELEIVCRRQRGEHLGEIAGNRNFADREGRFAILDPEAGRAAAVIAGDLVDAHADQTGHIEPVAEIGNQYAWACRTRLTIEVGGARRRSRGYPALGMAGGDKVQFARGRAVKQPCRQHAVIDQRQLTAGDTFTIERPRTLSAPAQRIINDANARTEQALVALVLENARLARDGAAIDRRGEMPDQ